MIQAQKIASSIDGPANISITLSSSPLLQICSVNTCYSVADDSKLDHCWYVAAQRAQQRAQRPDEPQDRRLKQELPLLPPTRHALPKLRATHPVPIRSTNI